MERGELEGGEHGRDSVEVVVEGVDLGFEVREDGLVGDGGAWKPRETGRAPAKATPTEQKRKALLWTAQRMGKLQPDDLTGVEKRVRDGVGVERGEGQAGEVDVNLGEESATHDVRGQCRNIGGACGALRAPSLKNRVV